MPQTTLDELLTLFEDFIRQRGVGVAIGFGELRLVATFQDANVMTLDAETRMRRKPKRMAYSARPDTEQVTR